MPASYSQWQSSSEVFTRHDQARPITYRPWMQAANIEYRTFRTAKACTRDKQRESTSYDCRLPLLRPGCRPNARRSRNASRGTHGVQEPVLAFQTIPGFCSDMSAEFLRLGGPMQSGCMNEGHLEPECLCPGARVRKG